MIKYILIVILSSGSGNTSFVTEFQEYQSCLTAKQTIEKDINNSIGINIKSANCFKK